FLPQVGVQASLLFLQKKTNEERLMSNINYNVFMAIAEKLGKDRRDVSIFEKDEDGIELIFDQEVKYLVTNKDGQKILKSRREKAKRLDDDLPKISQAYSLFKKERK